MSSQDFAGSGLLRRALVAVQFRPLADVLLEVEPFANIANPRTRRLHQKNEEFRIVTHARVIAWRKTLEQHNFLPAIIRRKLLKLCNYL